MKKTAVLAGGLILLASMGFASGSRDSDSKAQKTDAPKVVASTSWTAAFADLAGIDSVSAIAPANLQHPPEYELTVSDIQKIDASDLFLYAGYERMMETLGKSNGKILMQKIHTDNSISTVTSQSEIIAKLMHTEDASRPRVASYVQTIEDGKKAVQEAGLDTKKVLVHTMQVYLAKDLGLEIAGTFGPGPVTAGQLADAKAGGYDIIIDNVHNPVAGPLAEVSPSSKVVVWRNFPENNERGALEKMVSKNIEALLK